MHLLQELYNRQHHTYTPYPSKPIVPFLLPRKFSICEKYSKGLFCGEFTADGLYFISSCQSGCITIYSVSHGTLKKLHTYWSRNIQWSIIDTKLSPDYRFVAYSSWSGTVHLVPFLDNHQSELHLMLSDANVMFANSYHCAFSLSFSQDSKELILGTNNGRACVFDLETSTKVVNIGDAHYTDVNSVSFSNNTNHIIYSGADDGFLKIWDRRILSERNPKPVSVFVGHCHGITYHDSKGDFRYILTNSKDQSIKLWDTRHPSSDSDIPKMERIVRYNSQYWDYRQTSSSRTMLEQHCFLQAIRWQFREGDKDASVKTYTGHTVSTTLIRARFSPAFSTLQQYIYTGSATGKLYIYDINSGDIIHVSTSDSCHKNVVRDVSWHPFEPIILTSSLDSTLGCTQYRDVSLQRDCEGPMEILSEEESGEENII